MRSPSTRIRSLERSGIREVFDLASTLSDVIHLEMGEPDFPTPTHIVEAAARAGSGGFTKYTPNAGLPELRDALAEKVSRRNGLNADPGRILVTPGAIAGLYGSFLALCDPGDEVLISDPAWPNYRMICGLQGLEGVRYPLRMEDGLVPNPELIEPLITDRTRVLLVNTPSNPTGVVLGTDVLSGLGDLATAHDLWIVSDEVYDELYYDGDVAPSVAAVGDHERVVTVWSFSKTYAMTGWRVGYALAPTALATDLIKTQEPITACVNAPAQMAALAALTGPQDCVTEMRAAYLERRDETVATLRSRGVSHIVPAGAFYVWIDIGATGLLSAEFARTLLIERRVAVTPGGAFGPASTRFVRISLATEPGALREGVDRLADAFEDSL